MKTPTLTLTVLAAAMLMTSAKSQYGSSSTPQDPKDASVTKVTELQKERIAVLKALVDTVDHLYKNARVSYDELGEAKVLLFKAQLETATKPSERVALCQALVSELKLYEEVAEQAVQRARATRSTSLKIKAARLEAQIWLELAEAKAAQVNQ